MIIMAKDKEEIVTSTEAPVVEATKAFKFKLLGGKHYVGEIVYKTGDIVSCDDNLAEIHGKTKFELVQG